MAGGLICGLVISNPITPGFRRRRIIRAAAAGLGCVGVMLAVGIRLPRPIDFQGELTKFDATERKVLTSYRAILLHSKNAKDGELADRIETQVTRPWSAERQSLAHITGLPKRQQHLVDLLLNYMDARQQAWTKLVVGFRTYNVDLVKQSFVQQLEAQSTLKAAMKAPQ